MSLSSTQNGESRSVPAFGRAMTWVPALIYMAMILAGLATLLALRGGIIIEDDARYYTIIAENIVKTGRSTFDGQVLTNGYHPLWLVVLVVMAATTGLSDFAIAGVELLLSAGGLYLLLSIFRSQSLALRLVFVAIFAALAAPLVCRGMEVSIFIFAFGLFVRTLQRFNEDEVGPVALGLSAGLAIGARLDSAVFIVPTLILVAGLRRSVLPLLTMALAGAAYAAFNLMVFGIAFPVSGAVKSLGGVQLNYRYLREFAEPMKAQSFLAGLYMFERTVTGKLVIIALLCLAMLVAGLNRATPWILGFLLGLSLYLAKLSFGSSWAIWSWYGFPMFIGLFAFFLALDATIERRNRPFWQDWRVSVVAALVVVAGAGWIVQSARRAIPPQSDFEQINKLAAERLGPILKGERVAMGDRSGSFAHYYRGPVTQTEGLVNDTAFLDVLRKKGDVKALLCARGVRYVLAYQVDLGGYDSVKVPVLRRNLTQYDAPAITLSRRDEVARVFDLERFDSRLNDEGDSYLYVWRLNDCPVR